MEQFSLFLSSAQQEASFAFIFFINLDDDKLDDGVVQWPITIEQPPSYCLCFLGEFIIPNSEQDVPK